MRPIHLLCTLTIAAAAPVARADWSFSILNPPGQASAGTFALGPGIAGGFTGPIATSHATIWDSYSPTPTMDVNPAGASQSSIGNYGGGQFTGQAVIGGVRKAGIWTSAGAFTSLHPTGYTVSYAIGTDGTHQVGYGTTSNNVDHALMWSGTAASKINLDPPGSSLSYAYSIAAGRQVGSVVYPPPNIGYRQAGFWTGTAASFVLLGAPAGFSQSEAMTISPDGLTQGGYAVGSTGSNWACLWRGTPDSFVSLNPAGFYSSSIGNMDSQYQVGWYNNNQGPRAAFWHGTADSFFDLSSTLPARYTTAYAQGIYSTASDIWASGYAYNTQSGFFEAILWHDAVPGPGAALALLAAAALPARRRSA